MTNDVNYDALVGRFNSLNKFGGEELETKQEEFIFDVLEKYDMVAIGSITIGNLPIEVDSIYYDQEERKLKLHVSCPMMEGDVTFSSLQPTTQADVTRLAFNEMKHIENGPTLYGMMVGSHNIMYRNVLVHGIESFVKVTTEEFFSSFIKEGSPDDDKFYCYVPTEEFYSLDDKEFEVFVNKYF